MALNDLELIYLLSAHGQEVYGLALARCESEKQAEQILQKVFVDLVNFPPALEGNALAQALSKKVLKLTRGKKTSAEPSPLPEAVEEEVLALMKEARDHEGILPPPAKKWRKGHTILAACLGFLLIVALSFSALLSGGGETMTDDSGSGDLLKPITDQATLPGDSALPEIKEDLYPFETIQSETCTTYTDLSAFIAAIGSKNAPGFGSNYYNARGLLLLPNRLPDQAKFRYLYLNPQTGSYSYSFQFEAQKTLYLLDFEVSQTLPASERAIEDAVRAALEEQQSRAIEGSTLTCTFGEDRVTVTLSAPNSKEPISEKQAKAFLDVTILERCSEENPFLKS